MLVDDKLQRIPPKGIKAQRDFLLTVLEENQEEFRRIVADLAYSDPKMFVRLYKDLNALVVPKQNELNVSLTLNKDFQELQALSSTGSSEIEALEYEELDSERHEELDSERHEELDSEDLKTLGDD